MSFDYFNARYYDATIGRFINVDPVQDGSNWYVYCGNNPLKFVDPNGLSDVAIYWRDVAAAFPMADGPLPFGDAIYVIGYVGCSVYDFFSIYGPQLPALIDKGKCLAEQFSEKASNFFSNLSNSSGTGNLDPNDFDKLYKNIEKAINKYPSDSFECKNLANELYDTFSKTTDNVNIIEIRDMYRAEHFFDNNGVKFAASGFHQAVKVGDRVFDAITGSNGMVYSQYIETLSSYGIYPEITIIK